MHVYTDALQAMATRSRIITAATVCVVAIAAVYALVAAQIM